MTRKSLDRRTFLRGIGMASLALPALDAMTPAFAPTAASVAPVRAAFLYVPNGIIMKDWKPVVTGEKPTDFSFSKTLKPLESMREHITVLSGLDHYNGQSLGDGAGDHARAGATWLTGVHPKKTEGLDIKAGISIDQLMAKELGKATQLPSLELGLDDNRMVGGCDSGYSCAYSNTLSWSSPSTPVPLETNPRAVFERLFGDGDTTDPQARALRARQDRSILDFVNEDAKRLGATLGASDRRKLSEYMDSIREIEVRIQKAENPGRNIALPAIDQPAGIPPTFEEHIKLMFDLMTIAFQADLTRVITMMIGREGGNRTYRSIGVPDAHHGLSHHFNDPAKIERLQKIDQHHVEMVSYFIEKLSKTKDSNGTLLDNSMVLYGSSISDGNKHEHLDLPAILCGHGGNQIKGGRHLQYRKGTPMTNLFMTMADQMGVKPEKIGDSTGRVEHLTNI
ncbi:DUF1552 domain-containing protein [Bryobacter aggregatus]|uniref:DUF1552 domain-containing protein n=1 Tax=Bryobacter aggregatus TaxID=360054 RepID=UPI001EE2D741|nr:DUF1552 domain-containing protein [Bryobacter aggregatus]